jgi:SP family general alpha glucoside:H+ symporter-like MFS transporter
MMASEITGKPSIVHHDGAETDLKDTQKAEAFLADAQAGNDSEVKMGLFAALRLYPKASAWSIAISFAVVMEGESCSPLLKP